MALTTEQKINLLILAGFEPRRFVGMGPRLVKGSACLSCTISSMNSNDSSGWNVYISPTGFVGYENSNWEWVDLSSCPDELIYEAIEATTG